MTACRGQKRAKSVAAAVQQCAVSPKKAMQTGFSRSADKVGNCDYGRTIYTVYRHYRGLISR